MGVVIAKFLQSIEIGPRELPGGLHQYNIYLEGVENRILFIPSLFPRHRLDNGKRDAHRPGQHTHDHLAHEDGGQVAVHDIIGVDGAVDRPVARETIDNKSDQSQGFHKNYHAGAAPAQIGMKTEAAKFPVFLYNVFERHTTKHGSRGGGQGVSLAEKY